MANGVTTANTVILIPVKTAGSVKKVCKVRFASVEDLPGNFAPLMSMNAFIRIHVTMAALVSILQEDSLAFVLVGLHRKLNYFLLLDIFIKYQLFTPTINNMIHFLLQATPQVSTATTLHTSQCFQESMLSHWKKWLELF